MVDSANEGKKAELLSRIERLRELVVEDAPAMTLSRALDEVGRSLDGLTRPGRAEGNPATSPGTGESPPAL
jgi:hypothetical protein